MKHLWKNYNLSIVLAVLFLSSWVLQTWMGWQEFNSEQQQHGQAAQVFGSEGYIWRWGEATFENWQSEFLQLLTFVILTAYLIHKGSAESKDGDEEMQAALQRIEQRLDRIESAAGVRQGGRPLTQVAQTGGGQDTPATEQTEQLVYRSDWAQDDGAQADGARERSHTR